MESLQQSIEEAKGIPTFQLEKMSLKELMCLPQGHVARKWHKSYTYDLVWFKIL